LIDLNLIVVEILLMIVVVDYYYYYSYDMINPYEEEEEVLVDDDKIVGIDLYIVMEFVHNNPVQHHHLTFVMLLHDDYDHERIDFPYHVMVLVDYYEISDFYYEQPIKIFRFFTF
jgi:hypothetical protein